MAGNLRNIGDIIQLRDTNLKRIFGTFRCNKKSMDRIENEALLEQLKDFLEQKMDFTKYDLDSELSEGSCPHRQRQKQTGQKTQ